MNRLIDFASTAYHEAGHVVMLAARKQRVRMASIRKDGSGAATYRLGFVNFHVEVRSHLVRYCQINIAGMAAEIIYHDINGTLTDSVRADILNGSSDDTKLCIDAAIRHFKCEIGDKRIDILLSRAAAGTNQILFERWILVEEIAQALLESRRVSGKKLRAMIRAYHLNSRRPSSTEAKPQ